MAIFNEILVGRYNKALQRAFGIKASAPVRQLGGEILPVTTIFRGVEEHYLESWNLWGATRNIVANVGNVGTFQLRVPTTSNVIVVVEKLTVTSTNAAIEILVGTKASTTDLATALASVTRETRQLATTSSAAIVSTTNVTVPGPNAFYEGIAGSAGFQQNEMILTPNQEVVITPGFVLQVQTLTANVSLIVSIFWRERYLEESERI